MREVRLEPVMAYGTSLYESTGPALDELLVTDPALMAVFALSDEMAADAVNELQSRGSRAPEDLSVLGFDDTRTAIYARRPSPASLSRWRGMGRLTVEWLLDGGGRRARILPHRIVERGSVQRASG